MEKERGKKKKQKGTMFKRSLFAASAVFVIGATTVAAQNSDYFSMFFGHEGNAMDANQNSIKASKIVSGIEMEVEETIIGGKSALIIVSFEKQDGTAFSNNVKVPALELDWKQNASYMVDQQMTEDHKKLIAMFDIDTTKKIDGKKLKIMANKLVDESTDKVIADGPFHLSFEASESSSSKTIETNINLALSDAELSLQTINISANGIGVEGTRQDGKTGELPQSTPLLKVTTLDNHTFELKSGSTSTTETGFKWQFNLDEAGERLLLSNENIKSVTIDGHTIEVTKE
ncbi:hypothetical protein [Ureibacillus sinduriensis]|uniref:DUF4179 domain-containing protein n=1 Tax=Ureibacillus sinduriensis BLB-1 = JCM 15800 TaxID=1384057 RepID=A0A0A3I106_9BACL|nr:hypothetical protein [Ureibacillus sinduriensis]KGR76298.1 hypothetical protein CD33_07065 [Ureibacillus sinduriensis BLB-1 = JCM 15800]